MQYLLKYSDENNACSAFDIIAFLEDCGLSAERRSIYRDIEEINKVSLMLENECTIDEAEEMLLDDEDFNYMSFIREISVFCNLCMSIKSDEQEIRERVNKIYDKNLEEVDEEIEHIEEDGENQKN